MGGGGGGCGLGTRLNKTIVEKEMEEEPVTQNRACNL